MAINIKPNKFQVPTEIREEVVQHICEAFLRGHCWSTYHPFNGAHNGSRNATDSVIVRNGEGIGFIDIGERAFSSDTLIKFHGCEMRAAFKELIKAGYHMFRIYEFGSWMGYVVSCRPYRENGDEVTAFTDNVD